MPSFESDRPCPFSSNVASVLTLRVKIAIHRLFQPIMDSLCSTYAIAYSMLIVSSST